MLNNTFYRDAFVKCSVIDNGDGLKLDLPFQIYHQTVIENGNNHYCYLDNSLKDKEVIAYIHYAISDDEKVKSFIGYLGNDWKVVQDNPDVIKNWWLTKADALAIVDSDTGTVTKYSGSDATKIAHPYIANEQSEK